MTGQIGRLIGLAIIGASNVDLAKIVLYQFKDGGLWVVKKEDDKYVIKQESISQEQFQAAMRIIIMKGENGLNIKEK